MDSLSLAEQGRASPPALPTAGVQQPLSTSPSIPIGNGPSRQESTTDIPVAQNEDGGSPSDQAGQAIKPKHWLEYPSGYPQLAAYQARGINTDMFRGFEILANRVLLEEQTSICILGQALFDLDKEDEQIDHPRLKNLAFDHSQFLERCLLAGGPAIPSRTTHQQDEQTWDQDPEEESGQQSKLKAKEQQSQDLKDRKDRIMEALIPRLNRYYELALRFNQISGIPKVTKHTYTNMLKMLTKRNYLTGEAWKFLREEDQSDFFTTRRNRVHESFENLIFQNNHNKFLKLLSNLFISLFQIRNAADPADPDPDETELNTNAIEKVARGFVALFCGAMLLAPVAILLLAPLSELESLGVVIAFGALLVLLLSLKGVKLDNMLIGLSAYVAVLAAFLSNLIQGRDR